MGRGRSRRRGTLRLECLVIIRGDVGSACVHGVSV
jgi:hypothetical protein